MRNKEKSVRTMGRILPLVLAAVLLALPASAQEKLTERTFRLKPGATSPPATIADMAWLAGHGPAKRSADFRKKSGASPRPAR